MICPFLFCLNHVVLWLSSLLLLIILFILLFLMPFPLVILFTLYAMWESLSNNDDGDWLATKAISFLLGFLSMWGGLFSIAKNMLSNSQTPKPMDIENAPTVDVYRDLFRNSLKAQGFIFGHFFSIQRKPIENFLIPGVHLGLISPIFHLVRVELWS